MATKTDRKDGKKVLVRTYSAGVHFGLLVKRTGKEVTLRNARRIWRWRGANTLNEVARQGVDPASSGYTRISEPVSEIVLTETIEVLAISAAAWRSLIGAGWAK